MKSPDKNERRDWLTGWGLVAPATLTLLAVAALPFIFAVATSFADFDLRTNDWEWVGLSNYVAVLSESRIWNAVLVTGHIAIVALLIEFILGLTIALALWQNVKARNLIMVVLILPAAIAPIAVAEIWKLIFSAEFGPVNYLISRFLGLQPVVWLNDPAISPYAIIIADVWQWTPFVMLLLYSGLLGIPRDVLEASQVDGATYLQQIRLVVLPMLKPVITVTLIIRAVDMLKIFELPFTMTGGGPGSATETLSMYIYLIGFKFWRLSDAAVATIVVMIIAVALVALYVRNVTRERFSG